MGEGGKIRGHEGGVIRAYAATPANKEGFQ
jgi:hypothetical protein